jgi:hypothetical protein
MGISNKKLTFPTTENFNLNHHKKWILFCSLLPRVRLINPSGGHVDKYVGTPSRQFDRNRGREYIKVTGNVVNVSTLKTRADKKVKWARYLGVTVSCHNWRIRHSHVQEFQKNWFRYWGLSRLSILQTDHGYKLACSRQQSWRDKKFRSRWQCYR